MPKKIDEVTWACSYCGKRYQNVLKADGCEKSHRLIYIPMPKEDLMALINYLYTSDVRILEKYPNIMRTLLNYARIKETEDDVSGMTE